MYCKHCGAAIDDDAQFCTACGLAVAAIDATAKMTAVREAPTTGGMTHSVHTAEKGVEGKRSKLPAIMAGAIGAVAFVALAVVLLLLPQINGGDSTAGSGGSSSAVSEGSAETSSSSNQPGANSSPAETGNQEDASSPATSADSATMPPSTDRQENDYSSAGTPNQGRVSSPVASPAASQGADTIVRGDSAPDDAGLVSNAEARKATNLFLSNFTEVDLRSFDNLPSVGELSFLHFALAHDGINSPHFWETGAGFVASSTGRELATRESATRVDEVLMRYFGITGSRTDFASYLAYEDGYYYFEPRAVNTEPQGVASVTGSENLGGNRLKVYFNVYAGSYDASDQSIYGGTQEEIMRKLGASQPAYRGFAVIRTGGSDEVTGGMTLESFQRMPS